MWRPDPAGHAVELSVYFSTPDPEGSVSDTGDFFVFSFLFFVLGEIDFGDPETFAYTHGETSGVMSIDFTIFRG